ncbi:MAG: DUF3108 domain-containing protein [Piscinibacter sp.]|nr:DUF3108 domain-containing protein [Piscinibacter sp.]
MQPRPDRGGRTGLLASAALALLLHAWLFDAWPPGPTKAGPATPAAPVQVRRIEPAATTPPPGDPTPVERAGPEPAPLPVPAVAAPRREPDRPPAPPEPAVLQPVRAVGPAERVTEVPASASAPADDAGESPGPVAAAPSEAAAPAEPPGGSPPPLYKTVWPPAATLDYALRRGALSGTGSLVWRPADGRYELQLDGSVLGLRVLTQVSRGQLDSYGLAPQRFTDQRARRPMQAANFRRDIGRISFSGPSHEYPLWPGVQDRLSWMLQLAAIVAADPVRFRAGERIELQVVGARGDSGRWVFDVLGEDLLQTPVGPVQTLHLRREPHGPHDAGSEVWLDPARHHLPARALLRSGADDALELRLRSAAIGE